MFLVNIQLNSRLHGYFFFFIHVINIDFIEISSRPLLNYCNILENLYKISFERSIF